MEVVVQAVGVVVDIDLISSKMCHNTVVTRSDCWPHCIAYEHGENIVFCKWSFGMPGVLNTKMVRGTLNSHFYCIFSHLHVSPKYPSIKLGSRYSCPPHSSVTQHLLSG